MYSQAMVSPALMHTLGLPSGLSWLKASHACVIGSLKRAEGSPPLGCPSGKHGSMPCLQGMVERILTQTAPVSLVLHRRSKGSSVQPLQRSHLTLQMGRVQASVRPSQHCSPARGSAGLLHCALPKCGRPCARAPRHRPSPSDDLGGLPILPAAHGWSSRGGRQCTSSAFGLKHFAGSPPGFRRTHARQRDHRHH